MLYETIVRRASIEKGWSGDRKFKAVDAAGKTYMLRLSPPERYERRAAEFRRARQIAELHLPVCESLEFGLCEEGVYTLQAWIDGEDAEAVIPGLPTKEQYAYGLDTGRILQQLHGLPAPEDAEDWEPRFNRKIDRKIAMYRSCPLKYEGGEAFLRYIETHRHLLAGRPQSYQHGDYHIGNMMISRDGILTVIDFERDDWGDPWEEFNRIVWCAQTAPAFARGMVDGYFDGPPPQEFWDLLALYICSNSLSSLPWAVSYGEREITVMRRQGAEILEWYNHFHTTVPSWYIG